MPAPTREDLATLFDIPVEHVPEDETERATLHDLYLEERRRLDRAYLKAKRRKANNDAADAAARRRKATRRKATKQARKQARNQRRRR